MRTIKELQEYIAERPDDEVLFCVIFDKADMEERTEIMEEKPLTDTEWVQIVDKMNSDNGMWQEITETWNWHIEKLVIGRKANDHSK